MIKALFCSPNTGFYSISNIQMYALVPILFDSMDYGTRVSIQVELTYHSPMGLGSYV